MKRFLAFWLLLALAAGHVRAAEGVTPANGAATKDMSLAQAGKIAELVANILEHAHFKLAVLDDTASEKFLKNYMEALDYNRMIFIQADVDEFTAKYGRKLDEATLGRDVSPAFDVFKRYLQRLTEANERAQRLLNEKYDFASDESFNPSRNKAAWPKNQEEAEQLWRLRIKFELLQDRLAYLERVAKKQEEEKKAAANPEKKAANKEEVAKDPPRHKPEETLKIIAKRYQRLLRTMSDFTNEEILQVYLTALSHTYDPHSDYQGATEAKEFEIKSIKLSLTGIGATLQSDDGYTKIVQLVPGAPAQKSKQLKVGDRIVSVAQGDGEWVDVVEMPLNKVVQLIRGPIATEVRLTVQPASDPDDKKVIRLIRDEIKIADQMAKARVVEHPDSDGVMQKLGVIELPGYYENCSRDVEKLIVRLKQEKITGLILDLRRNGGGILEESVNLTGLFIPKGPVVQVKERDRDPRRKGVTQVHRDDDGKVAYDGPLIVMVSKLSASASEITAAALQDHGRAIIVGDQTTHGKGTVQKLWPLRAVLGSEFELDPGKLKLTVAKFYRVAGTTTQMIGVSSDIVLPSRYDYLELGEASLPNCLPADNIEPAIFVKQDRVTPYLPELRKRSVERTRRNTDFVYLNEDIEFIKKQQVDKSVSLSEAKRVEERDEIKAREEARKKERAQRKPVQDKIYDLTLKMVDEQAPLVRATRPKDDETLTAAAPVIPLDGEEAGEEEDLTKLDLYLVEGLNLLNDYRELLAKAGGRFVTEKQVDAGKPVAR